MKRLKNVSR